MMPCVKQRSRLRNRPGISGTVGGALAAILSWVPCGAGYGQAESGSSTNMSQPARPPSIIVSCYMITREASLYSYKGSNTSVSAVLLVNCRTEPSTRVAAAEMELSELRDDTGKDLLAAPDSPRPLGRDSFRKSSSVTAQGNWQNLFNLHTRFPSQRAKKLQTLKGKLVLTTPVPADPIRIPLDRPGKPFVYLGNEIALSRVSVSEQDRIVVTFTCSSNKEPPDVSAAAVWFRKAIVLGSKGETNENAVNGTSLRKGPGPQVELRTTFKCSKDVEPTVLVLANEAQPNVQEYPFEYHDLPLPSLTAAYAPSTPVTVDNIPALAAAAPLPAGTKPLNELSPTTVTLAGQELPVDKITEEIARATGIPLTFRKQRGRSDPEPPRVSVDWRAVPYWDALEDLCRKGNLSEISYPTLDVLRGSGERPASQQAVIGPVRLKIDRIEIKTSNTSRFPGGGSSVGTTDEMKLQLNGFAMVEPRITIFSHECQVVRCIASSGIDLACVGWTNGVPPPPWGAPHTQSISREAPGSRATFGLSAPLLSAEAPRRIAHLRLYYSIRTSDKMADYEIPDTSKAGTCSLSDGLVLRWSEPEADGVGVKLRFVFARDSGLTQDDLLIIETQKYSFTGPSGVKLAITRREPGPKEYVILCALASKADLPTRLRISVPGEITTYGAWFDFHDIDLPVLPAPLQ